MRTTWQCSCRLRYRYYPTLKGHCHWDPELAPIPLPAMVLVLAV
jgi:hypothetical protein